MKSPQTPEGIVQVLILLLVAGMAGAASFTHVHDWTMRNVPPGTGTWFGWANAIITELVPLACGLEVRRRKRQHGAVTYPMAILVIDAAVSLTAQLSDAIHTLAGALAFALPALAFLALTKLVLARTHAPQGDASWTQIQAENPAQTGTGNQAGPTPTISTGTMPPAGFKSPSEPPVPSASGSRVTQALAPDTLRDLRPVPPGHLVMSARMTAFDHHKATGRPITPAELAERLVIPPALAESLLEQVGTTTPPTVPAVNGTSHGGAQP